jgi:hypothetical protein
MSTFVTLVARPELVPIGDRRGRLTTRTIVPQGTQIFEPTPRRATGVEVFSDASPGGAALSFVSHADPAGAFGRGLLQFSAAEFPARTGRVAVPGLATAIDCGANARSLTFCWDIDW